MYGVSLILAPFLLAISSFFWIDGEYGVVGGTILVLSMVFWMPVLVFLFGLVKDKLPNYATWGLLIAMFGFISGSNFAFVGIMSEIFNISHASYMEGFARYPLSSNLLLFQSGPLAPLSLAALGIALLVTRSVPRPLAIFVLLGGITFPIGRMLRLEWVAHITDILLMAPLLVLGLRVLSVSKT
jgi:hypothetical protein